MIQVYLHFYAAFLNTFFTKKNNNNKFSTVTSHSFPFPLKYFLKVAGFVKCRTIKRQDVTTLALVDDVAFRQWLSSALLWAAQVLSSQLDL